MVLAKFVVINVNVGVRAISQNSARIAHSQPTSCCAVEKEQRMSSNCFMLFVCNLGLGIDNLNALQVHMTSSTVAKCFGA